MSLPVVYRRKVGRDLAAGFGYHEEQAEGLCDKFTVLHTARDPKLWPQARKIAR